MQAFLIPAGCGLASYLLGAIPFGYLIARARGVDIRRLGSGNIGATNVFRSVGKGWGILTFVCDALKGFAPVFFLPRIAGGGGSAGELQGVQVLCACMAIAGHNWPVYLGFKGGKGVATSTGALLGLAPAGLGIGLGVWLVVFVSGRYVSLASLVAAVVVGGCAWPLYAKQGWLIPITLTALTALVVWRHRGNIQRLAQGTEHRFQFGRAKGADETSRNA
jgi:glycerol-3-phosphate acyltransferase PlsY